jgi:hypothetical protein
MKKEKFDHLTVEGVICKVKGKMTEKDVDKAIATVIVALEKNGFEICALWTSKKHGGK